MLSDFEQRLANVLGARLAAPFQGRVVVASDTPAGPGPVVSVAVTSATPLDSDFGYVRPETVPGAADPRRVLKLACTLEIGVRPGGTAGRVQQMHGIDAVMYEMDAADLRNGQGLVQPGDPGFSIDQMLLSQAAVPLDPTLATAAAVAVEYAVEGWFWPVGTPGASGPTITDLRLRGLLPVSFVPALPTAVAGGPPIDIQIVMARIGSMALTPGGTQPIAVTDLAVTLSGPGGKPATGTLSNTQPGAGGAQLAAVVNSVATVRYTPPAVATTDTLIVSTDDSTGAAAQELGRVTIQVNP